MVPAEVEAQLGAIGSADLVIGVPTFNHAQSIGAVLEAARVGASKSLAHVRPALVNSDAGSTDETAGLVAGAEWDGPRVLARHECRPGERLEVPCHGIPGRAAAQGMILEAARRLGARACVLLAPDCQSMTPEWVERLARPILEDGYDYVAPLYQRHRYDGTLTSGLVYPLMRALSGKRIRQPLGGVNGLSAGLVERLCGHEPRDPVAAGHGPDLWMTAVASTEGFRVCEGWLGPWAAGAHGRPADLGGTLAEVVGPLLALLEATAETWARARGSEAVPAVGAALPAAMEPVEIDTLRMVRAFKQGVKDLLPLWEQVLSPESLGEVLALAPLADEAFRFPHEVWARVIYDFALGYRLRTLYRGHLVRSLMPLYLGRTAAFIQETWRGGARESDLWLERGCLAFERQKRYLAERWP
jgi:hypothetical protein